MNIIAYGSLMNKASLEKTLQRPVVLKKIEIPNYKRTFNAPFGDYAFLNLVAAPEGRIEAAYFTLEESELDFFTDREAGSQLVEVVPDYYAFIWPNVYCKSLPVLASYMAVCRSGAERLSINFDMGLGQPKSIVDDTMQPLYWV